MNLSSEQRIRYKNHFAAHNFFIRKRKKKYDRWKYKGSGSVFGTEEMCDEHGFPDYDQNNTQHTYYRHDLIASSN